MSFVTDANYFTDTYVKQTFTNVNIQAINITGNAATATAATNDSDGNAINTTYAKLGSENTFAEANTFSKGVSIGDLTLGGTTSELQKTISCNDTLYIKNDTGTSMIFQTGSTKHTKFYQNNFVPYQVNNTSTIGATGNSWANLYAKKVTFTNDPGAGANTATTNTAYIQWNSADSALDFIFV